MFGAFFHQDWVTEGEDWPDLVRNFRGGQPPEELEAAARELDRLLGEFAGDEELEGYLLNDLGCEYTPRPDLGGPTVREWLGRIAAFLRREAGPAEPNAPAGRPSE
jgi:hypothetical protein